MRKHSVPLAQAVTTSFTSYYKQYLSLTGTKRAIYGLLLSYTGNRLNLKRFCKVSPEQQQQEEQQQQQQQQQLSNF